MSANGSGCLRCAGRTFSEAELQIVAEVVANGGSLSRAQLMGRVCQRLRWRRPSGALKVRECRDLLEAMEHDGRLRLPPKRKGGRPPGSRTRVPRTPAGEPGQPLLGTVGQFGTVSLQPVTTGGEHGWWRELIGRYHYLGYRVPFGAQMRYLAFVSHPAPTVVAALQLSSPAWRLAVRDRWIGWDEPTRVRNLQRVVNNSRFLVLPWVRVKNLASRLLSLLAGRLAVDWHARFATEPLLLETLVDRRRFAGTCYRAAGSSWATPPGAGAWTAPMPAMGSPRSGCWCILWWPTRSAGSQGSERWVLRSLGRPRLLLTRSPTRGRRSTGCCGWRAVRRRNG